MDENMRDRSLLLQLTPDFVEPTMMVIFGEHRPALCEALKSLGFHPKEEAYNREFITYSVSGKGTSFKLVTGGIGSSSVSMVVYELGVWGAKNLVLAGSCGASDHFKLGESYLVAESIINGAAISSNVGQDIISSGTPTPIASEIAQIIGRKEGDIWHASPELIILAQQLGLPSAVSITSDVFYEFGCLRSSEDQKPVAQTVNPNTGSIIYAARPLVNGKIPEGVEKAVKLAKISDGRMLDCAKRFTYLADQSPKPGQQLPFLVQMEDGPFFELCQKYGLRGISIRGGSNPQPFDFNLTIDPKTDFKAMQSYLSSAIRLMEMIKSKY